MDRDLDHLLTRLRRSDRDEPSLGDVERRVDERIAAREARRSAPRLALGFPAMAVTLAFAAGLAVGAGVPGSASAAPSHGLLVDLMEP